MPEDRELERDIDRAVEHAVARERRRHDREDRRRDREWERRLDRDEQRRRAAERPPAPSAPPAPRAPGAPRSFVVTWLLALLLGLVGADRFYLGKTGTAVAKLLTVGGAGLWYLIDLVLVLTGNQRDRWGRPLVGGLPPRVTWIVTGVVVLLGLLVGLLSDGPAGPRSGLF